MNALAVIPIGSVDLDMLRAIELSLWQTFGPEVRRLPALPDPHYAFDANRSQWNSTMILREMTRCCNDALRVLGVTERDLFIPMLSFVYGQAQVNGKCALVSLARLRPEFYGLPASSLLTLARAVKETTHEMGHSFGLTHCLDNKCPMSLSNTIYQVDFKGEDLCENCLITLEQNLRPLLNPTSQAQEEHS